MTAILILVAAVLCLSNGWDWALYAMCAALVVLPPKWNPAFWHLVKPGSGEIRDEVKKGDRG